MEETPRIIIIAGPNGAGKTTFAREFLPGEAACPVFVNADLIAAGIAPFAPETASLQAGRLMLQELARHLAARTSFAFETTLLMVGAHIECNKVMHGGLSRHPVRDARSVGGVNATARTIGIVEQNTCSD